MKFLKLIFLICLIGNSYAHGAAAAAVAEKKIDVEAAGVPGAPCYNAEATAQMWKTLKGSESVVHTLCKRLQGKDTDPGSAINTLLSKKADPNARGACGISPLGQAIFSESL